MDKRKNFSGKLMLLAAMLLLISNFSFGQRENNNIPKDGNIFLNPEFGNRVGILISRTRNLKTRLGI